MILQGRSCSSGEPWQRKAGWRFPPLRLVTFVQVGLPVNSSDRTVWRFAQAQGMILLTHNRNMKDENSLEQTIREEKTPTALP